MWEPQDDITLRNGDSVIFPGAFATLDQFKAVVVRSEEKGERFDDATVDLLLGRVLRRLLNAENEYTHVGERHFTADGSVDVSEEEIAAIKKAMEEGQHS